MQYLKYPTKKMKITQNYNGKYSHYEMSHGEPCSYPIDENCGDTERDWFYAPCDLVVKRIYGVGNKATNSIFLESSNKVLLANGKESYVTILVCHPEDSDLNKIKIGQKFKQNQAMFKEGKDGYATGNHFHIEVATCKFNELKNNGWVLNSKNVYVISNNAIKPEQAFLIDKNFTNVIDKNGINFKYYEEKLNYYPKCKSSYKSLVEALKSINVNSTFAYRTKIANKNGIKLYVGSAKQNTQLLDLLKQGKLLKI